MTIIICAKCGRKEYQSGQSIYCDNCKSYTNEPTKDKKIYFLWKGKK